MDSFNKLAQEIQGMFFNNQLNRKEERGKMKKSNLYEKASNMSRIYKDIKICSEILAKLYSGCITDLSSKYTGGWRVRADQIERLGIDLNSIYWMLERKLSDKKEELEQELYELKIDYRR